MQSGNASWKSTSQRYDPNDFYPNGQSFEVDLPAFITHFTHTNSKEIFWKIVYT